MKNVSFSIVLLTLVFQCFAQDLQWAKEVREFSSQRSATQYSAQQILFEPNAVLGHQASPCVWTPEKENGKNEEFIKVRFAKPEFARQIVICEVMNPGAISKVYTVNTGGFEKLVYENEKPKAENNQTNVLNVIFEEKSATKIQEVKVVLNTKAVKGFNGIDAIGLSTSEKPFQPELEVITGANDHKKENLGNGINSAFTEYLPQISPDGKTLYFARRGHPDNKGAQKLDDIWVAESKDGEVWQEAKNIGAPLNDDFFNYVFTITPDGNTILLGNVYRKSMEPLPGVSRSHKSGKSWSFPSEVKIDSYVNQSPYNEFCLSANKRVMIMAINDGKSLGDNDLYVSFLTPSKTWTKPVNMGAMVNTAAAEASPFLAADGKTLYFSSNGYLGYGKNDIYMTKRLDDTWKNWTKPVNMGPVINSEENELYYSVPASGKYAYFVSKKQTLGESDIFRVELPNAVKPFPVTMVTGKVLHWDTKEVLQAEVHYDLLPEGADVGEGETDSETGEYKIIIPQDHMYGIHAMKDGFFPISERIDEENIADHHYHTIDLDLYLAPLKLEEKFVLHNVVFNRSTADLKDFSYVELNHLVKLLKQYPSMALLLVGHTDNTGYHDWNKKLSIERIEMIKKYLIEKGISKDRLTTEGRGGRDPMVPNDSEANKAKNRRVEVVIKKM